ncbi:MAG TPA: peptide deformylase [Planctomycetota bacterium]|nr:peptide deformylase [Planctomycetota bacterium]
MELLYYPDPRLRERAQPVDRVDDEIRRAVPRMFEIMYRARGIGLAGPQVALARRVVVANLTGDPKAKEAEQVFLNPEILEKSGRMREEEGCLSLPGIAVVVPRAERVVVRYRTLEERVVERAAEGLEAKLFQHEIDHLDGILLVDKMTPADRKQWAPLLKELEEQHQARARRTRGGGSAASSPGAGNAVEARGAAREGGSGRTAAL